MNSINIQFKVIRDASGVSGFTLMGVGETNAECYCLSFLTAQQRRKASVEFKNGKIVFTHGGVGQDEADKSYGVWGTHEGGIFSANISNDDAKALEDLLHKRGVYENIQLRVRPEFAWGKGFTLYANRV